MTDERSFERLIADRMAAERGSAQLPDSFYDDFRKRARKARQRPRWLALIKEPPMRTSSTLAVGSPTARVAAIVIATLLLALTLATAGIAGSRLLAADGTLVVDPADPNAYHTISDAVADATDGDTVLVKPGTYAESVAIGSDITVRGDGERGSVVIAFASPADGPSYLEGGEGGEPFGYGILLDSTDARVSNLTLQGPADDGSDPAVSGVYIVGGAPVVEGIDIILDGDRWNYADGSYYRRSAVRITGGSTATVRDSTWDGYVRIFGDSNAPNFEGNTITAHELSIADGGHQPVIRNNVLLEGASLWWDDAGSGGSAVDNDITGFIEIEAGNDPVVRENRIRQQGANGHSRLAGGAIGVAGGSTPRIESNQIVDSITGIVVTVGSGASPGAAPVIADNTIEDNATGVSVRGPSTVTLSGNTFCGNEQDLEVPEGSELTLEGNTVCDT